MKSIEKLREYAYSGSIKDGELWDIVDAIEQELAEHYVKLPVDADGVPIRVGDMLCVRYQKPPKEVAGFGVLDGEPFVVWYDTGLSRGTKALTLKEGGGGWDSLSSIDAHHVQPDTWERIISDAIGMTIYSNIDMERLIDRCKALAGDAE